MSRPSPSALITGQGQRVLLRIQGRLYELSQQELRTRLGLPEGPPGLGITIDRDRFRFEFAASQPVEFSSRQLQRRLAKQLISDQAAVGQGDFRSGRVARSRDGATTRELKSSGEKRVSRAH